MDLIRRIYPLHKKHIWRHLILGILGNICVASGVRMLQLILDSLAADTAGFWMLGVYGILLMEPYIGAYLDNHPSQSLAHGIYFQLKTEALEKMRTVSYIDWQKYGTGTLIQRVEAGAAAGRDMCCEFYIQLAANMLPQIVITGIFIAVTNIQVFYWVLAGYVVVFIITNMLLKMLYSIKHRILFSEEIFNHRLVRGFMELVVFRLHRRFGEEIRKCREEAQEVQDARVEMVMIHEAFFTLFVILVGFLKLAMLGYAIVSNSLSVGSVVALISYLDNAYQPIAIFNVNYVQYKLNKVAYERLDSFMHSDDVPNMLTGVPAALADGSVEFSSAGCIYDERHVYSNLSFSIPAGSVIGFAGESGSGKSSILKQLAGLVPINSGDVYIGGCSISEICLEEYYRSICYITQEAPVFDGSIRENIVFDADIPDSVIMEALQAVELGEFMGGLENGLDTQIGERGITLSGGERQRLALARLYFADDAQLVMLDEATSAMDNVTEERVLRRILTKLSGKTIIMVAHRLDTLRNADSIMLLKNGVICGQGSYEELAAGNNYFNELLKAQDI